MYRTARFAGVLLSVLVIFGLAPAAGAQEANPQPEGVITLNDVYNAVQTAINRSTAARDRAIEARDNSLETVGHVRDGFNEITGTVSTAIDDAVTDLKRILDEQIAGRQAFLDGGGAATFRAQLIGLTTDLETLLNSPFGLAGLSITPVDMQRSIDVVNNLPDRALYPLYVAMTSQGNLFDQEFLDEIQAVASELPALTAALQEMRNFDQAAFAAGSGDLLDEKDAACATTITNRQLWRAAATHANAVGLELKAFGALFKALGETGFDQDAGIHGYVHVTIKNNPIKKYGGFLEGVGTSLMSVGSAINKHVSDCENVRMLANLRSDIRTATVPSSGSIAMGALMLVLLAAGTLVSRRRQARAQEEAELL